MFWKALALAALLQWIPVQSSNIIPVSPWANERICTIDEEMREKVRYLITECAWTDRLPLEWEIPWEECFITLQFNRRCENPDFPLD